MVVGVIKLDGVQVVEVFAVAEVLLAIAARSKHQFAGAGHHGAAKVRAGRVQRVDGHHVVLVFDGATALLAAAFLAVGFGAGGQVAVAAAGGVGRELRRGFVVFAIGAQGLGVAVAGVGIFHACHPWRLCRTARPAQCGWKAGRLRQCGSSACQRFCPWPLRLYTGGWPVSYWPRANCLSPLLRLPVVAQPLKQARQSQPRRRQIIVSS